VEGNGSGRGGPPIEGVSELGGEVHGAATELMEVRTWPKWLAHVEALEDTAVASETLPSADALSTCQSRPVPEEGVAPMAQLDRAFEAWSHGTPAAMSSRAEAHSMEAQVRGK
jgi:hypothetical protein